jgi:hypothetical protein
MQSLHAAFYDGVSVDLEFHIDGEAHPLVLEYVLHNVTWSHGQTIRNIRSNRVGLMLNIMESWQPTPGSDQVAIFLEDDLEVSPFFFRFIRAVVQREDYRRDPNLFGIALYSPKTNELVRPIADFRPRFLTKDALYLMQLPCSWGAVYFPEHWGAFQTYARERVLFDASKGSKGLYVPPIPGISSNRWTRSWKRFFIEYAFLRGFYMVYPNFAGFVSFATTHQEFGEHTGGGKGLAQNAQVDGLRTPTRRTLDRVIVPLMSNQSALTSGIDFRSDSTTIASAIPSRNSLTLFNVYHRNVSGTATLKRASYAFAYVHRESLKNQISLSIGSGFCILDWQSTGSRNLLSSNSTESYLFFQPQSGLTNQLLAFQDAVALAQALNRTLVIPPVYSHAGERFAPHEVLDLESSFGKFVRYITLDQFRLIDDHAEGISIISRPLKNRFASVSLDLIEETFGLRKSIPIPTTPLTATQITMMFGGCLDRVLVFDNLFMATRWRNRDFVFPQMSSKALIGSIPVFNSLASNYAQELVSELQQISRSNSFSCMHLRRGDFQEYCQFIAESRQKKAWNPYKQSRFNSFSMDNCFPSLEDVSRTLIKSGLFPRNEVLFLSTNEKNETLLETTLGSSFKLVMAESLSSFESVPDILKGPVSQLVCQQARLFVGNEWSTFSRWISTRRPNKGQNFKVGFGRLRLSKR